MSFYEYWDKLLAANPAMQDSDVKMSIYVSVFKEAIRRAYEAGKSDRPEKLSDVIEAFFGKAPPRRD